MSRAHSQNFETTSSCTFDERQVVLAQIGNLQTEHLQRFQIHMFEEKIMIMQSADCFSKIYCDFAIRMCVQAYKVGDKARRLNEFVW